MIWKFFNENDHGRDRENTLLWFYFGAFEFGASWVCFQTRTHPNPIRQCLSSLTILFSHLFSKLYIG